MTMRRSKVREESNLWLRRQVIDIEGRVLSIGSGTGSDREGGVYRDYFKSCSSYVTSDLNPARHCDLVVDVRSMPQIPDKSFCSWRSPFDIGFI
jgi:hypothetical protein